MSAAEDYPWWSAPGCALDSDAAGRAWSYVSAEAQHERMCNEIDRLRARLRAEVNRQPHTTGTEQSELRNLADSLVRRNTSSWALSTSGLLRRAANRIDQLNAYAGMLEEHGDAS